MTLEESIPTFCALKECPNEANGQEKYFVLPNYIWVPNAYLTCDDHKNVFLDYDYFYDDKGNKIWKKEEIEK